MKTLLGSLRLSSSKQVQGTHIVVYEENSDANQTASNTGGSGRGRAQRKPGKKVQFQLVSEGGKLVIKDIKI